MTDIRRHSLEDRDTIRDLTAFMLIARERSFTRAAAELNVSQSALSYTMRKLEERLGVRLLTRTTRNVAPTEAGEVLLEQIRPHFEGIGIALQGLNQFRDRAAGTVRINTTDHAVDTILRPVLAEMLPAFPEINVELLVDNGLRDIVDDRCDAGIRIGEHLDRGMIAMPVGPPIRMAVVAAPAYLDRNCVPQRPADLMEHECIAYRVGTHGAVYDWEFVEEGRAITLSTRGQIVCNDPSQIVQLALDGFGIACMPESYFDEHVRSGRLRRLLEAFVSPFPGYYIYYTSRRQPTPAFSVLLDHLRRHRRQAGD